MAPFPWRRAVRSKAVWFSLLVLLAFAVVAALTPWLAPHDPYRWQPTLRGLPPMWVQDASAPGRAEFPLGTDWYGRDILSRLVYGTRTAFILALAAVALAALIGGLAGLVAGYAGGRLDAGLLYLTDVIQALPGIMFLVMVVLICRGLLTPTWFHGMLALVIGFAAASWAGLARLVRVAVRQVKSQLFVAAAIGIGAPPQRIIARHLLPNVLHVIVVWIINNVPAVILLEAVLGYIGVGVTGAVEGGEFTVVSWGGMFFSGRSALSVNALMLVIPSVCILLISMSFILLGDFLNGISRQGQG